VNFIKLGFGWFQFSVSQSKNSLVLAYKMVLVCMVLVYMVLVYKQLLFHQPFRTLVHGSYHDVCRMVHGCSRNTFPHVHHMNRPTWAKCCYNTVIYFVVVWKVVMFVESDLIRQSIFGQRACILVLLEHKMVLYILLWVRGCSHSTFHHDHHMSLPILA